MAYVITEEMIDRVSFVHRNRHAKTNAISALEVEIFKQKYKRSPCVVEIWDFDEDIKRWSEIFCEWIYHYLYVSELKVDKTPVWWRTKGEIMRNLTFDEINRQLNEGLERTPDELEACKKWLIEFATANQLSLKELNDLCWEDSTWIFEQVF